MNRRDRGALRAFRCEALEARALLTTGSAPLADLPGVGTTDSILVEFSPTATPAQQQQVLASIKATVAQAYPDGPEVLDLGRGVTASAAVRRLKADPTVAFAELNSTIHIASVPVYPDDPSLSAQWGLGQPNGVNIDAPSAWGITTGSPSTIVAVLDSGIDLSNPDFAGRIWTNPVDDTAEGFPGDVHGWNFVGNNANVQDVDGHGTHVSGIIAATGNDGYGVAGVDWQAQIMPIKFLDSQGNGTTAGAVAGIYYAVAHGAQVINASWGGYANDPALAAAIAYADEHNVVFVTAAGNDGTNNDIDPSYPASYRLPNELAVTSVDQSGNLPSFANFGPTTVDVAAPGVDILSDAPASVSPTRLQYLTGTSMSTAYVSGVAALLAGEFPTLTAAQIVERIDATAKPLPALAGRIISGGIVDADNALTAGLPTTTTTTTTLSLTPAAGIPFFSPGLATSEQIQGALYASDEFFDNHGASGVGFITGLYQDILGRTPDPTGLALWTGLYNSGEATRYQIAEAMITTPEARLAEVARWYQDDLGRTSTLADLEADPGVQAWAGLIDEGFGDATVQAAILSSTEFLLDNGGTPASIVQGWYQTIDARTPTDTEDAAWAGLLDEGTAPFLAVRFFQGTPEAAQTTVAGWFTTILNRPGGVAQLKADPGVVAWASLLGNY